MKKFLASLAFFTLSAFGVQAADEGYAKPWQLGFQTPATPVMQQLYDIHNFLLIIITLITIFVLIVMVYICVRFRRSANPVPSKTTHNTRLEIIWTTIPILILVVIAIPSLRLHYFMEKPVNPEMTLKVTGYQWYWHYDYPDNGGFGFDSYIKKGDDLKEGDHRLLAVDNRVIVPVDTTVRVLVTGADVIHSWAMPAFGVKKDGVPGRLNETWFKAEKTGTFYGQCSELCGVGHGFMPIVVDVVSKEEFSAWVKKQPGGVDNPAAQKTSVTLSQPVSAKNVSPHPTIEKEKAGIKPAKTDLKATTPASKPAKGERPTSTNQGTSPTSTEE